MLSVVTLCFSSCTLHPAPCTLRPALCALHPAPLAPRFILLSLPPEQATTLDTEHGTSSLAGKRVFFAGKLEDVTKRDAHQLARSHGAIPVPRWDSGVDVVVTRSNFLPLGDDEVVLAEQIVQAAAQGRVDILSDTTFWQR